MMERSKRNVGGGKGRSKEREGRMKGKRRKEEEWMEREGWIKRRGERGEWKKRDVRMEGR